MKKRLITIIVLLLLIPFAVNAESVKTGKFRYMPSFEEKAEEERYYYSDDYFKGSGKEYNEHLMGMSYSLALSTFEVEGSDFCSELLKDIGFDDIQVFDMNEKPTLDSLGMLIGHKKANGRDLIAVAIRGSKYGSEWGNNFIVGEDGDAKGFSKSSAKAAARIRGYIDTYGLDDPKIWITGYSRAGAVADLLGVYMNENPTEFDIASDDLYVYTFETPAASADDTVYDNIYIIKNRNDLIPFVYPEGWGFHTNGRIIEMGESRSIMTYIGLLEQEAYEETDMKEFYQELFSWLSERLSRKVYCDYLEEPVSRLLDLYFSKSDDDREALLKFFTEDVRSALLDNKENKNTLIGKAITVMGHNSDYLYEDLSRFIVSILDSVRNSENGSTITDQEYQTIRSSVYPLLRVLGPLVIDDSNYFAGIDYDDYYTYEAQDYSLTDEEMGEKYGKDSGFFYGYDAAVHGYDYDDTPDQDESEYGPDYLKAYQESYVSAYAEGNVLGIEHLADPEAKGKYDAAKYAYYSGYYAGNHHEEYSPDADYYYQEDWMSDEYYAAYEQAYIDEYERLYDLGYKEGQSVPEEIEEDREYLNMYHVATLIKNVKDIMPMHIPQNNLELIQKLDSYYAPYELTEGADQTIDISYGKEDELTVKTGGHLEKLVKVQVDDQDLKISDYELRNGSTILTLKDRYLKTLAAGTHTLKLVYIDNVIQTQFTINKQSPTDKPVNPVPYSIPVTGVDHCLPCHGFGKKLIKDPVLKRLEW